MLMNRKEGKVSSARHSVTVMHLSSTCSYRNTNNSCTAYCKHLRQRFMFGLKQTYVSASDLVHAHTINPILSSHIESHR